MKLTVLLGLCLGIGCVARAQPPMTDDARAIWKTEFAWNQAYVDGDATKLAQIEGRNYVFTENDGMVHGRSDELAEAKAGEMHFTEMSLHEAAVLFTGDTAVVTGRLVVSGGVEHPFGEIDESTDTLVRENGAWHAVASSEVRLGSTAASATFPLWRDGGGWLKRHEQFVAEAKKGRVDLLFVGDSITDFWRTRAQAVWDKFFGNLHAANLGISGDRTQHVLWRLDHGEIDGLRPKAVVLLIGTNNTGLERDGLTLRNTPAQAAEGVKAVVADTEAQVAGREDPSVGGFSAVHSPRDLARLQVAEVNRAIAGLDDGDHVRYLDIGARFLTADGMLEQDMMPDYLHPSVKGYEIWAQAIQAPLAQMFGSGR